MRRPIFIVFCIIISISFVITNYYSKEDYKNYNNGTIVLKGLVNNKSNKNNYYVLFENLYKNS